MPGRKILPRCSLGVVVGGRDSNRSWNAEPTPNKSADERDEEPQKVGIGKGNIKHRDSINQKTSSFHRESEVKHGVYSKFPTSRS